MTDQYDIQLDEDLREIVKEAMDESSSDTPLGVLKATLMENSPVSDNNSSSSLGNNFQKLAMTDGTDGEKCDQIDHMSVSTGPHNKDLVVVSNVVVNLKDAKSIDALGSLVEASKVYDVNEGQYTYRIEDCEVINDVGGRRGYDIAEGPSTSRCHVDSHDNFLTYSLGDISPTTTRRMFFTEKELRERPATPGTCVGTKESSTLHRMVEPQGEPLGKLQPTGLMNGMNPRVVLEDIRSVNHSAQLRVGSSIANCAVGQGVPPEGSMVGTYD